MSDSTPFLVQMNRRRLLRYTGLLGLSGPVLVACGSDDDEPEAGDGGSTETENGAGDGGAAEGTAGTALVAAVEVPVGGGVVLAEQNLVVVQPTEGEFKGYTATCTHQGTPLNAVEDGLIVCPAHGSRFAVADGSVSDGPATSPLAEVPVAVEGDQIVLA